MRQLRIDVIGTVVLAMTMACATAPKSRSGQIDLERQADATLQMMRTRDTGLDPLLRSSAGYVVFPEIGKGGFIAGAAYGRGVLYERGRHAGFVELNQASIGAQLGGQTFSELIVLRDQFDVDRLKTGQFSMGANASAVALTEGAAGATQFTGGTAVFVVPRGGMMAELTVSGQQLNYKPLGG